MASEAWQIVGAGGAGIAIKALFDWLRNRDKIGFNREALLWKEIGEQKARIDAMEVEIKALREDRQKLRSDLQREVLLSHMLRLEINGLLRELGREPKYDIDSAIKKNNLSKPPESPKEQ